MTEEPIVAYLSCLLLSLQVRSHAETKYSLRLGITQASIYPSPGGHYLMAGSAPLSNKSRTTAVLPAAAATCKTVQPLSSRGVLSNCFVTLLLHSLLSVVLSAIPKRCCRAPMSPILHAVNKASCTVVLGASGRKRKVCSGAFEIIIWKDEMIGVYIAAHPIKKCFWAANTIKSSVQNNIQHSRLHNPKASSHRSNLSAQDHSLE